MPETTTLWPNQPADTLPTLTWYPRRGADVDAPAVLVIPGGGYRHHGEHEGMPMADALNHAGFHAAVLLYRLGPEHGHPDMIHDAQRAMRLMRGRGWSRVGVMGFSAGGHLAATLSVHHDRFTCEQDDLVEMLSARPDATVLVYPVIDMAGASTHQGSRLHLLGEDRVDDAELLDLLSVHRHVTADTPPSLVLHCRPDEPVPVENALMWVEACQKAGAPWEMYVSERGGHGTPWLFIKPEGDWFREISHAFLERHLID
ncbi:MAG: alpha/beta hydrolase [Planctomycetota bacterium]